MNGSTVNPPLATVNSQISVNNSCNCCCFPWRRRRRTKEAEAQVDESLKRIQEVKDSAFGIKK